MAELTKQTLDLNGITPTFASASSGGDVFDNSGSTLLYVKNGDSTGHDVTLQIQNTLELGGITLSITDPTVTVPASDEKIIGPFPTQWFNDDNGQVNISYDATTSVTVGVLEV